MSDPDMTTGLYQKYEIKRLNDPDGKHDNCFMFVLDPKHDKFALDALWHYAMACMGEYPELAKDLHQIIRQHNREHRPL